MAQWTHNKNPQVMTKLLAQVGASCIVKFQDIGERRGVIEAITKIVVGDSWDETVNLSEFKVLLTSGDIVTVPGSAISRLD
jgi:hypothetical protein